MIGPPKLVAKTVALMTRLPIIAAINVSSVTKLPAPVAINGVFGHLNDHFSYQKPVPMVETTFLVIGPLTSVIEMASPGIGLPTLVVRATTLPTKLVN